ncbi:hypothetical protein JCM30566_06650 [Marinitoga arctica]
MKYGLGYDKKRIENIFKTIKFFDKISDNELELIILENYTIGESYFFRDEKLWKILPNYLSNKNHLDILNLGCSRGEESYNFSFILNDLKKEFNILGVDASKERIKQAKEGKYTHWSVRFLKKDVIEKYFDIDKDYYYVKKEYKRNVDFIVGNILDILKSSKKYDLITMRRVLIYFNQQQIDEILTNIKNILKEDGILILGHGEFYPVLTELFEFESNNGVIIWKNQKNNYNKTKIKSFNNNIVKPKNINNKKSKKNHILLKDREKNKLLKTFTNLSEEEYIELIENLISKNNFQYAYELITPLAKNSLNFLIWKYKALIELNLGNFKEAKKSIDKAIFLYPDDDDLWDLKKMIYRR